MRTCIILLIGIAFVIIVWTFGLWTTHNSMIYYDKEHATCMHKPISG